MIFPCNRQRDPDRTLPVRAKVDTGDTRASTLERSRGSPDLRPETILRTSRDRPKSVRAIRRPRRSEAANDMRDTLPGLSQSSNLSFDSSPRQDKEAVFNTTFRLSPDRTWKPKTAKANKKEDVKTPEIRKRQIKSQAAPERMEICTHLRTGSESKPISLFPVPHRPIRILHRLSRGSAQS